MKKRQPKTDTFPFVDEDNHIYNQLVNKNYNTINVGWETFTFELHSNLVHDTSKVHGLTEFDKKTIKLEMSLSDEDAREVIFHEVLHCILEGIGLDERNFDNERIFTTNESLVTSISLNLKMIDRLNPGFLSLLFRANKL